MIGYITLGTNDLPRATEFYDALLSEIDAKRIMEDEGRMIVWGTGSSGMVALCKPYDGNAATVGNGVMVALNAGSKDMVHKIYDKAIALGGADEGPPGPRSGAFYGGYFRDPDGNKLVAFYMGG